MEINLHTLIWPHARIGPQWLTELRQSWLNVPWQVACELISGWVPTLCLDSIIVSPLRFHLVKGVCMLWCNLPPALLAERLGSFTCHCGNTGVEWTLTKSQHMKLMLEKIIFPQLLSGAELATFQSRVWHSYQQAILGNKLTRNLSGNIQLQLTQLAVPLWTDLAVKSGISVHELISTYKKKSTTGE